MENSHKPSRIFVQHVLANIPYQEEITSPHWFLGRTRGNEKFSYRIAFRSRTDRWATFCGSRCGSFGELEAVIGPAGERVLHPSRPIEGAYNRQSGGATDSI